MFAESLIILSGILSGLVAFVDLYYDLCFGFMLFCGFMIYFPQVSVTQTEWWCELSNSAKNK